MSISIGADPEMLLIDQDGDFVSVEGLVGGTKDKPVPLKGMEDYFMEGTAVQEDNVMLEFNTSPAPDWSRFEDTVMQCLSRINDNILRPADLQWSQECSGTYSLTALSTPQGSMFGCSPDMDAYTKDRTKAISPNSLGSTRFSGGHIHLGYDNPKGIPDFVIVQLCDAFMGLQEVRRKKSQGPRREFYGTAGRYRSKSYGVEYRTLSNAWLFDYDLLRAVSMGADRLARYIDEGDSTRLQRLYMEMPMHEVQRAINTEDSSLARELTLFLHGLEEED